MCLLSCWQKPMMICCNAYCTTIATHHRWMDGWDGWIDREIYILTKIHIWIWFNWPLHKSQLLFKCTSNYRKEMKLLSDGAREIKIRLFYVRLFCMIITVPAHFNTNWIWIYVKDQNSTHKPLVCIAKMYQEMLFKMRHSILIFIFLFSIVAFSLFFKSLLNALFCDNFRMWFCNAVLLSILFYLFNSISKPKTTEKKQPRFQNSHVDFNYDGWIFLQTTDIIIDDFLFYNRSACL